MTNNPEYSYLDPTYPAYYWYFDRPKTLLCFSLRRFILILTIYDIIFSSIAVSFSLIYLLFDQLTHMNLFQSNSLLQNLTSLPIGFFFDDRILLRTSWTIKTTADNFRMIIYLHIILNGSLLLCSINMLTAIRYYKPYRAFFYFVYKMAYFINTTTMFVGWTVNHNENSDSIRMFYGNGDLGFFTPNINIFCLALLECLWKTFSITMIFRSIQYIRDYCLHKEFNSIKTFNNAYPSTTELIIHIMPKKMIVNKQYHV